MQLTKQAIQYGTTRGTSSGSAADRVKEIGRKFDENKSSTKNYNADGTPKDMSNSSLGGNSLWMPISDLETKLLESLSNAASSFQNLVKKYKQDAKNQTVEINQIRQNELQEFKDCIAKVQRFCEDF